MILTRKPYVYSVLAPGGLLWRVDIDHVDRRHVTARHVEHWRSRVTAMNCALAVARTSQWRIEEDSCSSS